MLASNGGSTWQSMGMQSENFVETDVWSSTLKEMNIRLRMYVYERMVFTDFDPSIQRSVGYFYPPPNGHAHY